MGVGVWQQWHGLWSVGHLLSLGGLGPNTSLCPYGEARYDSQTQPLKRIGHAPTWRDYNGT